MRLASRASAGRIPVAGGAEAAARVSTRAADIGHSLLRRVLAVGTFWKILLANAAIVAGAVVLVPDATHALQRDVPLLVLLGAVTGVTLLANAFVLRLALEPLLELERAATRVAAGEPGTRARLSPFADRPLAELTRTFNRMVQTVEAQRERSRQIASRALTDAEEAKRRLSHELRDDTAQTLTMALIRLRALKAVDDLTERERTIDEVRDAIAGVIEQLRSFAGQLRPAALDLLGLDQVIEAYATGAAGGTDIRVSIERAALRGALSPEAEIAFLRIAQEAIDGAFARATTRVHLRLQRTADHVIITAVDDGAVDPGGQADFEAALFAMRERASYFGGTMSVSPAGSGTTVRAGFPLNRAS